MQEQGLRSFAQVEQEVQEKIVASEKMSLPTSAIPYNLAEEQKRLEEITQKRTEQQQLLTKQIQKAKEWQAVDPTYAVDIARINEEVDVQTKASLLKEREEQHLQALKTKAATINEVDQEFLTEQIQLTENRVKTQGDLLAVREAERSAAVEKREQEIAREREQGANTTATNATAQQGTKTEQGTNTTATNAIAQQGSATEQGTTTEQGTNTTAQQRSATEQERIRLKRMQLLNKEPQQSKERIRLKRMQLPNKEQKEKQSELL
jgi:hypothetical protein